MKLKLEYIVLVAILLVGMAVRFYKITNPIADWHSWRQADTAAVTRNFVKNGVDVLRPRYDDISNVQTGKDNPEGYRMVEFPIYNLWHYVVNMVVPACTFKVVDGALTQMETYCGVELAGRIATVLVSVVTIWLTYLLAKLYSGGRTALLAAGILAVLPYSIYYSRVVLPDPMMLMWSMAAIYLFEQGLRYAELKKKVWPWILASAVCGTLAMLLKPTAVFLLATLAYSMIRYLGFNLKKWWMVGVWGVIVLAPFAAWRMWIQQFPEGIPAYTWLLNGDGIRLRPAWWRWIFYERIGLLILGGFGLVPLALGVMKKNVTKDEGVYLWWWGCMFAYLAIFATGNVRHDYYQIILAPLIAMTVARGLVFMVENSTFNRWISAPVAAGLLGLMLFISWYNVRGYYQINNPAIVEAGRWADQVLPTDAKVIAPYQGDTAFLYQTNRQGWPLLTHTVEQLIEKGATHYVSVNNDAITRELEMKYHIQTKSDTFSIVTLTEPR